MATEADIKDFTLRRLGKSGCMDVELTDEQLDDAVDEAKRWWMRYQGNLKKVYLTVVSGQSVYDVVPDAYSVVDVLFEEVGIDVPTVYDVENYDIYPSYIFFSPNASYADLIQYIQYRETSRRVFGADLDWEYDRPRRKLVIFPEPTRSFLVQYSYYAKTLKVSDLEPWAYDMVRRYSLAMAMETLSYVRGKYSQIPSAGGEFSLNADTLQTQSEIMRTELTEQIKQFRKPMWLFGA